MLINARHPEEIRVVLTEDNHSIFDSDIDSKFHYSTTGNIYLATVSRVEVSLNAVFVDYGSKRHGFLPFKEIAPHYTGGREDNEAIKTHLKEGTRIIIQVSKDERGNKGAAVSSYISLAGCYLVLMPNNGKAGGISRRIEGEERQQLKDTLKNLTIPEGVGVIIRTAGLGRSPEELQWDLDALFKLWSAIETEANNPNRKPPCLIYRESDAILRSVRDYLRQDIDEIIVDTESAYQEVLSHIKRLRPDFIDRLKKYTDERPLFSKHRIETQLETAHARQVDLPSGGALVIDHTEALTAIDINSARATKGGDIEETALKTNLEAAAEIAKQARLRDLGGLIVIDFIDMLETAHQKEVENALIQAFDRDRARVQFGRLSRFGLLEMSRQRLRPSLRETTDHPCPRCEGRGVIRAVESLSLSILREIEEQVLHEKFDEIHLQLPIEVATFLLNEKRSALASMESAHHIRIAVIPNPDFQTPHYSIKKHKKLDDTRRSYELKEARSLEITDPFANDESQKHESALIKQVEVPDQPKPRKAGLLQRIWQDLFGAEKKVESRPTPSGHSRGGSKGDQRGSHPSSRNRPPRASHQGDSGPASPRGPESRKTNPSSPQQNRQGGVSSGKNDLSKEPKAGAPASTAETPQRAPQNNTNKPRNPQSSGSNGGRGQKNTGQRPPQAQEGMAPARTPNSSPDTASPSARKPVSATPVTTTAELVINLPTPKAVAAKPKSMSVKAEDVLAKPKAPSKFKQSESKLKSTLPTKIEVKEVSHQTEFSLDEAKQALAKKKKAAKQVETISKA
jgi:ribonuclease E